MRVDYVRVYQDPSNVKTSCDPSDAPTAAYIKAYVISMTRCRIGYLTSDRYEPAYTNPNYTDWQTQYGEPFPGNSWDGDC